MRPAECIQRSLICSLTLLPSGCTLTLEDVQAPAVQRPTSSSNTATELRGTLSLEMGADLGSASRSAVPMLFRWGVTERTEFAIGGDFYQRIMKGRSGVGDLQLSVRHRVREMDENSHAMTFGWYTTIPTASKKRGLRSGELDFGFSLARDRIRGTSTITDYYRINFLGEVDREGVDVGGLVALALSRPLRGAVGLVGEVSGELVPERDYSALHALLAMTYTPDSWTVVDLGLRVGFGDDAEDWAILVGFGRSLGRMMVP